MPKYEYACKSCGERLEVVQSFADGPLTECPTCGGVLRKVFSPPGIAFKGSGFYRTDNRKRRTEPKDEKVSSKADASSSGDSKTDGKSGSTTETKAEPAKKETAASASASGSGSSSSSASASGSGDAKPKRAEAKTA